MPAYIGLGSNLGDRKANLDFAISELRAHPDINVRAVSSYYETPAIGGPENQIAFLNAAAHLETGLSPTELLGVLHRIEAQAGREREVRWGARTLDLDVLLFDDLVLNPEDGERSGTQGPSESLCVPHPRMLVRRFVLVPLSEIAPECVDPVTGRPIANLLAGLDRRPSYLALHGCWSTPESHRVFERVADALGGVSITARDVPPARWITHFESEPEAVLTRFQELLNPQRWSDLGETWLVSDFTFREAIYQGVEAYLQKSSADFEGFMVRIEHVVGDTIPPTFAVCQRRRGERPSGYSVMKMPALGVIFKQAEAAVAEIVAACHATRAECIRVGPANA